MKKFFVYLKSRPLGMVSLILLIILYTVMIFAEFFAPYPPGLSFADKTYHPPNGRFYEGTFQAQEWRVTNTVNWKYVRVRGLYSEVHFFGRGEPYKLFGLIPADRHLFTTEPGAYPFFLMGADNLGRDLFSRIVYGSRISLTIGFIATAISLFLAVLLGGLSGYFGGATDWTIMRFSEFFMLIPGLYLILFLRSLLSSNMDSGQSYMMITIILSLVGWPGSTRTIRGMVHAIKREEFVLNAQLEMIKSPVIILRHIIPQIASLLIVSIALSIPGFIMTETTLSYLGLGIVDPAVSWGSLIKRDISTITNLRSYPWLLGPVWFLLGVTLAFNFLGDCLRDFYDPYHVRTFGAKVKRRRIQFAGNKDRQRDASALLQDKTPDAKPVLSAHGEGRKPLADPARFPSLLEVRDLSVGFTVLRGKSAVAVEAVRGVSFGLKKGGILGIVGESGSGKSVSTLAIPGLLPGNAAVKGSALYEGTELIGMKDGDLRLYRGGKIGMIFQEPGRSYDPLQNMGNVFLETFRNGLPQISRKEALEKAAALLAETGLPRGRERLSNFPHQFSGGQLQRIGIALALAQGCELLIADEPTTALDVTIQKQIVDLLKTLRRTRQISIIFISHDIDLVADISDRILVMYGGLVMEEGASSIITTGGEETAGEGKALHPYTKALLAASPRFGSHYSRERLLSIPGKVTDPSAPEPGCPFAPRCTLAGDECRKAIPPLRDFSAGERHEVRCLNATNYHK
ncbi:MAG: dipeptide/oligopeptide/nickel ABC transporter permease/ATP-binding protein [Treponema sp.]|jgi:peptide/nickel transport system permease protein|nr:dipeptide/oligopeptide/nickel ABC transporter permease/ATP-binding protein [Treponema sp.]